MIINASTYTSAIPVALSDTINIPGPTVRASGASTSLTSNKLVDTNANFITTHNANGTVNNQGVAVGMVVYNMYAKTLADDLGPTVATVTAIDSNTQLSLSADIFAGGTATKAYNIYDANQANPQGTIIQVGSAENGTSAADIYVKTIDGDNVFISAVPLGTVLPLVVQRVMVGTAAAGAQPSTLTNAENIIAYI
jgi:hypothetical protein